MYVTPLGHIILITNQQVFIEKQQIPILQSFFYPIGDRTRGEHTNPYTTDAVSNGIA